MAAELPPYKKPTVKLVGTDSNAFAVLGKCREALKRSGAPPEVLKAFQEEAMAGDYDHLLQTCMKFVNVR